MSVMLVVEQPKLSPDIYGMMIQQMKSPLRAAKGFVSHIGASNPNGGMRIVEIWESEADARKFVDDFLKPQLPPGVEPEMSFFSVHATFGRSDQA